MDRLFAVAGSYAPQLRCPFVLIIEFQFSFDGNFTDLLFLFVNKIRKYRAGCQISRLAAGILISAGAGKQDGRLATAIGTSEHADRIAERSLEILNTVQVPDANSLESFRPRSLSSQSIPDSKQLPVNQRQGKAPDDLVWLQSIREGHGEQY